MAGALRDEQEEGDCVMSTETKPDVAQIAFDNCLARTPWLLEHRSDPYFGNQIAITDSRHCVLSRVPPSGPEQFKLARIMATAPELLDELKDMTERFKRALLHTQSAGDEEIAESAVSKARAVIAKAEGRAS